MLEGHGYGVPVVCCWASRVPGWLSVHTYFLNNFIPVSNDTPPIIARTIIVAVSMSLAPVYV